MQKLDVQGVPPAFVPAELQSADDRGKDHRRHLGGGTAMAGRDDGSSF